MNTTFFMKLTPTTFYRMGTYVLVGGLVTYAITDTAWAIGAEDLKVATAALKKEVFDWLFVIKIAAVAVGSAFAVAKQSLTPFGIGAGIAAGVQFFNTAIGDGSAALLG
jgi:predicted RecA/RadA family phage recombinase